MIHSAFHECTGLKHPVISQGEHLESNPQAHSWMMELLSVSTQDVNYIVYNFMNVSTSSTYIQLQNANECLA